MRAICLYVLCLVCSVMVAHERTNFVASDMRKSMKPGDKAALLMVHFGTTYDQTRALTIEAINEKAKASFPDFTFAEAYTSRIVIRKLKERHVTKQTPREALTQLAEKGYTHVLIQSTNIIDGVEMESLRKDVATVTGRFKEVRVGNPLLYSVEDCERVVDIMAEKRSNQEILILVGHGTYTPSTAIYAMIDYMATAKGYQDILVGTIEGYPSFDHMLVRLKASGKKRVTLLPFMLVAGDHANNDIAGHWKEELEKEGFLVTVQMEGLGQNPKIQDIFIDHLRFSFSHKVKDIMTKKKEYAAGKE